MIRLSDFQLKQLSDFFMRFSQILLGSLVLKIFEPGTKVVLDKPILTVVSSGMLASFSFFTLGMFVAGKIRRNYANQ